MEYLEKEKRMLEHFAVGKLKDFDGVEITITQKNERFDLFVELCGDRYNIENVQFRIFNETMDDLKSHMIKQLIKKINK